MNLPFNKWLLLFFMLWFPLQGAAAAILSVCSQDGINHHTEQMVQESGEHHHGDCHKQNDGSDSEHLLTSLPCDDFSCEAYSHTLILPAYTASIAISNDSVISSYLSGFISFVPEQPQHPPLTV